MLWLYESLQLCQHPLDGGDGVEGTEAHSRAHDLASDVSCRPLPGDGEKQHDLKKAPIRWTRQVKFLMGFPYWGQILSNRKNVAHA